jgi:hypothetical protein
VVEPEESRAWYASTRLPEKTAITPTSIRKMRLFSAVVRRTFDGEGSCHWIGAIGAFGADADL